MAQTQRISGVFMGSVEINEPWYDSFVNALICAIKEIIAIFPYSIYLIIISNISFIYDMPKTEINIKYFKQQK
jgi:hypothetical protein